MDDDINFYKISSMHRALIFFVYSVDRRLKMKAVLVALFTTTIMMLFTSCVTTSERTSSTNPAEDVQYSLSEITKSKVDLLAANQSYQKTIEILGSPGVRYDASFLAAWSSQDCQLRALFIAFRPKSYITYCPEGGKAPWAGYLEKLKSYRDYRVAFKLPDQTTVGRAYSWKDQKGTSLSISFFDNKSILMQAEYVSGEVGAYTNLFDVDMSSGKTAIGPKVENDFTFIDAHPTQKDLESILQDEASKATSLRQVPYVLFSADWCPPCLALRESLDEPLMREAFTNTYIIEIDTTKLSPKDQMVVEQKFGVKGIPVLYELNAEGKPTGRFVSSSVWGADIPTNMAPPLKEFFGN
jgi:thiol-disulfide isomerase/thioredoxin